MKTQCAVDSVIKINKEKFYNDLREIRFIVKILESVDEELTSWMGEILGTSNNAHNIDMQTYSRLKSLREKLRSVL